MTDAERLVGVWLLPNEGTRTAEFHSDGSLTYTIHLGDRALVLELTWRLAGGMIVSSPPSVPSQEERSAYHFEGPDTLVLDHGDESFTYIRNVSGSPQL